MTIREQIYVTTTGVVHRYQYDLDLYKGNQKKHIRCPNCGFVVNMAYMNTQGKQKRIGYKCKSCKNLYLYEDSGKILMIKRLVGTA